MGNVVVECTGCKKQHTFTDLELDIDAVGTDDEREMGTETFYEGSVEFDCSCGNTITITHEYSEYPEGMPQEGDTNVTGATIISSTLHP